MTRRLLSTASNRVRCYGCFVAGRLDLRTLRETALGASAAGELWNPKHRLSVKVCRVAWRRK